jgi:hypothetical protein
MPARCSTVQAVAAVVWDQAFHSEADLAFLAAISKANSEWVGALDTANITFGAGSEAWEAVKRLATRQRDAAYARALAELEAHDEEWLEAAE